VEEKQTLRCGAADLTEDTFHRSGRRVEAQESEITHSIR
jgi:hypothetical protein